MPTEPADARRARRPVRARCLAVATAAALAVVAMLLASIAGAASTTVGAGADVSLSSAAPNTVGNGPALTVDGAPLVDSYLRFSVSGLGGTVQKATLNLFATDGSVDGPALYPAATAWNERKATWNTRPARTGVAGADVGAVAPGTWVSFDVTALVTGNGTYAFDLATSSADETVFSSREAKIRSQRPQLLIQTQSTTTSTSTTTTTVTTAPPSGNPRSAPLAPATGA